jgi:hypothetical protein
LESTSAFHRFPTIGTVEFHFQAKSRSSRETVVSLLSSRQRLVTVRKLGIAPANARGLPTMLGTEYSWLLTPAESTEEMSRVRLASPGLLTLAVAMFCLVCTVIVAGTPARARSLPLATAVAAPSHPAIAP